MRQRLRRRKANRKRNINDWHTSHHAYYQADTTQGVDNNRRAAYVYQNPTAGASAYPVGVGQSSYVGQYDYYDQQQSYHHDYQQQQKGEGKGQTEWTESDQMLKEHHQERRRAAAMRHDHDNDTQGQHHGYYTSDARYYNQPPPSSQQPQYDYGGYHGGEYDHGMYRYGPESGYSSHQSYGTSYHYGYDNGGGYSHNAGHHNGYAGYDNGYSAYNNSSSSVYSEGKMNPMDLLARLKHQGMLPN